MKLRTISLGILIVSLAAIFTLVAPASDVRAEDDWECIAYINDVNVDTLNTPGKALEVNNDELFDVEVYTPAPVTSHKIQLALTDVFPQTVSDKTDDGTETYYKESVSVTSFTKHGGGLYKLTVVTTMENGDTCSTTAYIRVTGESWLSTTAGILALVLAIGCPLILLLILLYLFLGQDLPWFFCGPALPLAAALTMLLMVTGSAWKPSSGDGQTTGTDNKPQAPSGREDISVGGHKFRPRILIPAIASALLSAIGLLLLFQQTGVAYPTTPVVVLSLVLALVAGIVLPILAVVLSPWRK